MITLGFWKKIKYPGLIEFLLRIRGRKVESYW